MEQGNGVSERKGRGEGMYQIGEYVVKSNTGICRVGDILSMAGFSRGKEKLYYLLIPCADEKAKIYVPTDQQPATLRRVLDHDQAWAAIHRIPQIAPVRIENEKQREERYKEALRSSDPEQWVSIIKTMYLRKQKRSAQGKKSTAMDDHYFKLAEEYLYSELALAIGRDKSEMRDLIADTVRKQETDGA